MRKNIDIPEKNIKLLEKMAASMRMKVKPFMEKMLIDFSEIEVSVGAIRKLKTINKQSKK